MNRKIICIVGPTASGKTALGVKLAKKFSAKGGPAPGWNGAEIISADSRQVYKGLDIGTNKDLGEYNGVKHHLIDVCEQGEEFSVFDWLELAKIAIEDIFKRGKIPIVVGGTGLYIQALVEGFEQQVKCRKYKVTSNKYTRQELDRKSLEELQEIYGKLPTTNDKLDLQNPRRLIREIERIQEGTCVSRQKPDFEVLQIGITLPRGILYEKIDRRVDSRFKDGMLEEVGGLLNDGVNEKWLLDLGLEYKIIGNFLINNFQFSIFNLKSIFNDSIFKTKEFREMAQELKWKTHAYARRQLTWFHRFEEIKWVKINKEAEKLVAEFLNI